MRNGLALLLVVILCAGAGLALAQPGTSKSRDADSTRAYLVARHAFLSAISGDDSGHIRAMTTFVTHVEQQCPKVLSAAPGSGGVLRQEAVSQLEYISLLEARPAYLTFSRTVSKLHWSSSKLTRAVARQAQALRAAVSISVPDLCVDAKAFAVSGYTVTPPATKRFLAQRADAEDAPGLMRMINEMLRPYERPNERALSAPQHTSREREETFFNELGELLRALGLPEH